MSEREKILGRIREALRVIAPKPGAHGPGAPQSPLALPDARKAAAEAERWLPPCGETFAEWLACFADNCAELHAGLHVCDSVEAAHASLRQLAATEGWQRIAAHRGPLTTPAAEALALPCLDTTSAYDVHELERCDASLTGCDVLVAQPGSVVVTSRSTGGRALSVLPPHHVVLATRDQLVPGLPAAFVRLHEIYGRTGWPGMVSFITGPSRTGDIERILVLGAHGPRRLTILLW